MLLFLPIPLFLHNDIEHTPSGTHLGVRVSNKSITKTQASTEGYKGVACVSTANVYVYLCAVKPFVPRPRYSSSASLALIYATAR